MTQNDFSSFSTDFATADLAYKGVLAISYGSGFVNSLKIMDRSVTGITYYTQSNPSLYDFYGGIVWTGNCFLSSGYASQYSLNFLGNAYSVRCCW